MCHTNMSTRARLGSNEVGDGDKWLEKWCAHVEDNATHSITLHVRRRRKLSTIFSFFFFPVLNSWQFHKCFYFLSFGRRLSLTCPLFLCVYFISFNFSLGFALQFCFSFFQIVYNFVSFSKYSMWVQLRQTRAHTQTKGPPARFGCPAANSAIRSYAYMHGCLYDAEHAVCVPHSRMPREIFRSIFIYFMNEKHLP